MRLCNLAEAINFTDQDQQIVIEDPLFRVGFEVEFVALTSSVRAHMAQQSISVSSVWREPSLFRELFDVDLPHVSQLMQKWIVETSRENASILDAKDLASSIRAAQQHYGPGIVRHLGTTKRELEKVWQSSNWQTPQGQEQITNRLLSATWTPGLWLSELGTDSVPDVTLKQIWKSLDPTPKFGWADLKQTRVYLDPNKPSNGDTFHSTLQRQLNGLELHAPVSQQSSSRNYQLTQDGTIVPDHRGEGEGQELISPPLSVAAALDDLQKIFEWISTHRHYTNDSCGLHIGVSYGGDDRIKRINRIKLLMLLGEEYLLELFDRQLNSYTQSHVLRLKKKISDSIKKGQDWTKHRRFAQLLQAIERRIDLSKYSTINFGKLSKGYLEFRIMGNEDYHMKFEQVRNTLLRYAFVLKLSLDPVAFEEEYKRELARLFSTALSDIEPVYPDLMTKYAVLGSSRPGTQMKNLEMFTRAQTNFDRSNFKSGVKILGILIDHAAKLVSKQSPNLVRAAALSYRLMLKKNNLTISQFVKKLRPVAGKTVNASAVKNYLQNN
jgi:hypothetical protein